MTTKKCKYCGQPTKPGRHKPDEYQHAQGCPKGPKQLGSKTKCRVCKDDPNNPCPWCAKLQRIARARKAGSTVTKKKSAASRANLAKGRRKMDPVIKRIMSERGVTRQRAHQIRNAKKRDADLAEINKEIGELFAGVKKLKRK